MRVLIVEDEQALREGLTDLLSAAGHEVVACEYGKDAVTFGTEQACDLVLLDLMLPDLNGVEVCRRLRRARPSLHILMLTARGSEDDKVAGLEAGADDYLTKPFAVRELLARINALGRARSTSDAWKRFARKTPPRSRLVRRESCAGSTDIELGLCRAANCSSGSGVLREISRPVPST